MNEDKYIDEHEEIANEMLASEDNEPMEGEDIDLAEDFDNSLSDIDFSQVEGKDFKSSFRRINREIDRKSYDRKRKKKPLTKEFGVGSTTATFTKSKARIMGKGPKKLSKVIVPRERTVIVKGVSDFILSDSKEADAVKNIGYYKGKKLKKLLLTFNNDSALDFNLELFNPSMPLDYLYSTSLNLNDKIQVGGPNSDVSYSDVLFNLLSNPTLIPNATIVISGPSVSQQMAQSMLFKNKTIAGDEYIDPQNMNLNIDNMQVANDIIYFDIMNKLNRPFVPDGMDVIQYKILAGNTVTMCFYYKQISLKRVMFQEARNSKKLLK